MDNVLGALAVAGYVVAQFLAVVAVSKWNASMSATDDLHRAARITGNERSAGRETNRSIESAAALAMIDISGRWKPRVLWLFARWRAARSAARDRRIRRIAEAGPFTIE